MALSTEQEEITKLQVRREKATRQLALAKKPMNDKIRAETLKVVALVKAEYEATLAPLVEEVRIIEAELKDKCK